ncbi:hypothetical protein AGMMS50293_18490 [Spirochaetia bacterium]|nr:hypothetical protein AGMMS50293_18490 [Spirochaetia bacterium]
MKNRPFCILIVYLIFPISGSLYGIGEKTISLGGVSAWNLAEFRASIAEVSSVRPHPVLILSSTASAGGLSAAGAVGNASASTASVPDLSVSFDEARAELFKDGAGHYRIITSPALEVVNQHLARTGTGAALFSGAVPGAASRSADRNEHLVIAPQSRDALFAPDNHIRDFSLEFWLYPLNMENGEQILSWISSRPVRTGRNVQGNSGDYAFQRIQCVSSKNRLYWTFLDFFTSPDGQRHLNINITGDSAVVPKTWSHHLIRFDADTGMLEYVMNGNTEAIVYASSTGREGGEVYTPIVGEGGSFTLGSRFMGLMDEFKIYGACVSRPSIQKYASRGGRVETRAIDLGEGNSGILMVEASGGRMGARANGDFRRNGRFRFADDSELQFFIRAAENPYRWDDSAWRSFTPGIDLAGGIRGRYVQLAVDFYPSSDGESSPYLEELNIIYMPNEPPLPPQGLTATAIDGGVQLHWRNSPDSDTVGYLIYYGTIRGEYFGDDAALGSSPIDAGKRNSLFVEGLKNGTLYYFRIAAYDQRDTNNPSAYHAGEFSREVTARPLMGLSAQALGAPE